MKKNDRTGKSKKPDKTPSRGEATPDQRKQNANAHRQADQDIENDAEFTAHNKNDDLDEGETARLGEDSSDLV
jgi:hypothetical protein